MDNRPIGIFDSGLGGLTCVKEITRILPGEDIIYFGDTGRVPYGTRSAGTIVKYVRQDINFLKRFDIKYIVIACGTASSAALPVIQDEFDTEIIGVLMPAAARAVEATRNKKVGVLGTGGTIRSGKYAEQIQILDPDITVYQQACPLFVPLVENGYTNGEVARLVAADYLAPLKEAGVDTVILGCTHYPLLRQVIGDIMGSGVKLVDAGASAADYAKYVLGHRHLLSGKDAGGKVQFFVSDLVEGFAALGSAFLERTITDAEIQQIDIEAY